MNLGGLIFIRLFLLYNPINKKGKKTNEIVDSLFHSPYDAFNMIMVLIQME